jgi:putative copper resistance protein D
MNLLIHSFPNWVELAFLAFSIGILTSLLWVLPPKASNELPGHEILRARMWRYLAISIFAMLATSILDLMMRSAEMSGEPVTEVFPELPTVIFRTHYGSVWLIRIAVLVLLSVLLPVCRRYRESRGLLMFLFTLGAVISLTESASGHAADAGDFSIIELSDWLHLMAAAVWGGGLFALSLAVLPSFAKDGDQHARLVAYAASRFSRIAGFAVGIIVLSALYNAWLNVGSVAALIKSSYGWTVMAKIVLLFILLYIGAFNRYVRVPRLRKAAGLPEGRTGIIGGIVAPVLETRLKYPEDRIARGFARSVRIEAVLMIAVLLCAALLRHEVPAKHYLHQGEHHQHPHH